MSNPYSSYKLLKHPDRLKLWKQGSPSPILIDLDLTNRCNNKCPLCVGSLNKDNTFIPLEKAKEIILQLKEVGAKAITFGSSTGDPTCHPNLAELIRFVKSKGIEVGFQTNGFEISDDLADAVVSSCTWARVSLDAGTPEVYKKTHGMEPEAWEQVITNLRKMANLRKEKKSKITLGVSFLIGPHTVLDMFSATKLAKEIGLDYIRFRPFFSFDNTKNLVGNAISKIPEELEKAKELQTENFSVSYAEDRCSEDAVTKKRVYSECYVQNFTVSIAPNLKVYPCCILKNNPKYEIGDLNKNSFQEIWNSEKRKEVYKKTSFADCPYPCMLEKHNELLHTLKSDKLADKMRILDLVLAGSEPVMHENFL